MTAKIIVSIVDFESAAKVFMEYLEANMCMETQRRQYTPNTVYAYKDSVNYFCRYLLGQQPEICSDVTQIRPRHRLLHINESTRTYQHRHNEHIQAEK